MMANKEGCAALLLILSAFSIACFGEQDRAIFIVLMKDDPVIFHELTHEQHGRTSRGEAKNAHADKLVRSHDQLLQSTLEIGSYNKLYSFKHVVNGFAVHTTPSQAGKLKNLHGVKRVERDRGTKLMTTYTPTYLGLPKGVWDQQGGERNAGEGIVIGFVDTGINPHHPSFAYDPFHPYDKSNISKFSGYSCEVGPEFHESYCNGKIVTAKFFSAGAQAIATLNASIDILSPFDATGHGSHVASIAAGNAGVPVIVDGFFYGRASGMAPRARIAVYKAIYPTVGTVTDLIAAIEQAVVDGVDILTLSIGPDEPPQDTLTFLSTFDVFMLFARRSGLLVVQAAGNQGPSPSTISSYSPWTIGVAASTTDRTFPGSLLLGNDLRVAGIGLSGSTFGSPFLRHPLVLAKDAVRPYGEFPKTPQYIEECQYPEALDHDIVRGTIVICTFSGGFSNGTSTLAAIIATANALGFMGFILLANPVYGDFVGEPVPFSHPAILIPNVADAQIVSRYYELKTSRNGTGPVISFRAQAAIEEGRVASFAKRSPVVSRFSSRGPDFSNYRRQPADVLKPDILAPGHQIWGAWSPTSALNPLLTGKNRYIYHTLDTISSGDRFALLSGTSMAAPHVAGIAALIKQYNPLWTPSMIASAISTTATKYDDYGDIIMAEGYWTNSFYTSTYFDFGAGLIKPSRAIDPGLVISSEYEDYLGFLCSLPNVHPSDIKVATGSLCTHSIGHPANLNIPSLTISALTGFQVVRRSVKNVNSKPETYLCFAIPPNGTAVHVVPSWFAIAPEATQELEIRLNVTQAVGRFTFGEIVLTGSLNHIVRIPLSVMPLSVL